jgi:conjugal transfer pilin signal peptidase TrbI
MSTKLQQHVFFAIKALIVFIVMLASVHLVFDRYSVGIGSREITCLPYKVFIIDKRNHNISRQDYVAFHSDSRMEPPFTPGSIIVKQVSGITGDNYQINNNGAIINENHFTYNPEVLDKISNEIPIESTQSVVEGFFVTGTNPRSYDSRYWGTVNDSQLIGKAYPIF